VQAAAGADGTAPVEYIPSEDNIVLRYADGLEVVMDFLHTPFGKLEPHYRTQMGTCPVRFEGDEGWVETGDNGDIIAHPDSLAREVLNLRRSAAGTDPGSHVRNFFDCVKSRRRSCPACRGKSTCGRVTGNDSTRRPPACQGRGSRR